MAPALPGHPLRARAVIGRDPSAPPEAAVVGGGPAGSVTALLLARAGFRVTLFDRAHFPRPKPCGECLNPGAVRGNHFHPRQKEFIIFLGPQGKLVTVDSITKDRSETIIEGKGCPLITVPPKVIHAVKNISGEVCYLLCYNDKPLDLEKDVIRETILT